VNYFSGKKKNSWVNNICWHLF